MRKSTTAVLLSALVMPGAGHLYLKRVGRGIGLVGLSLACLWVVFDQVMRQASTVVGQLEAQGGAIDPAQISDLVAQSSANSDSPLATMAMLVLTGCWLVGIIDAWRLGRQNEQE
jgi:TM2 domain-containing membrane protein YozV